MNFLQYYFTLFQYYFTLFQGPMLLSYHFKNLCILFSFTNSQFWIITENYKSNFWLNIVVIQKYFSGFQNAKESMHSSEWAKQAICTKIYLNTFVYTHAYKFTSSKIVEPKPVIANCLFNIEYVQGYLLDGFSTLCIKASQKYV